jgi:hypothetical protein
MVLAAREVLKIAAPEQFNALTDTEPAASVCALPV